MTQTAIGATTEHGARMNANYRLQRHIYDLTRKYYLLGRDRLIRELDAGPGMSVLEVGCGTGRNLIAAARRWPQARFSGLDISSAMLETAEQSVARHRLSDRIALVEADACAFDTAPALAGQHFDRIFLSYTLSMIPGWEMAIDEALDAVAPGGSVHIVDFGQQEHLPAPFRALLFGWLAMFHVTPRADLRVVAEEAAARHGRTAAFHPLYRGYAWSVTIR